MPAREVKIVTDSTARASGEEISRYDIHVVPLKVIFGTEIYTEGVDITSQDFYRRLAGRDPLPTTSQPSVNDFTRVYQELTERGHPVLSIHISSKLSGTVNSALAARQELPRAQIEVIDCLSLALRMLILPSAQGAARGLGLPRLKASIDRLNSSMSTVGMLNTLEYLWRGGRIGGARALLGTLLRIKPLLDFKDGEVKVLGRLRTSSQAMEAILGIMENRLKPGVPVHVGVAQTNAPESARMLAERVSAAFKCAELDIVELGPVLGTHLGPGFFGAAFYSDEDWQPDRG